MNGADVAADRCFDLAFWNLAERAYYHLSQLDLLVEIVEE